MKTRVAATLTSVVPEMGGARAQNPPLEPADDRRHRIEREQPLPTSRGSASIAYTTPERKSQIWSRNGNRVGNVSIADVDGREEERDAERGDEAITRNTGANTTAKLGQTSYQAIIPTSTTEASRKSTTGP